MSFVRHGARKVHGDSKASNARARRRLASRKRNMADPVLERARAIAAAAATASEGVVDPSSLAAIQRVCYCPPWPRKCSILILSLIHI